MRSRRKTKKNETKAEVAEEKTKTMAKAKK